MQGHCGTFRPMQGNPDYGIREIFARGVRNTAQAIRNPTNHRNPESKFHSQRLESSTWNPESMVWNLESKTVLDLEILQRRVQPS